MLRKRGLTPDQLAERYKEDIQKPYGEVDIVRLYGKPPYEFLGEIENRNYPNYADFNVQFIDDIGREYQATDSINRFFVRIPMSITRKTTKESKYEDIVGFPKPGDELNLTWFDKEIHARVIDCPFDSRSAVSNIFFENILIIDFVPDFIDESGRYFMRCVRNKCFLDPDENIDEEDTALYYVRLPSFSINRKTNFKNKSRTGNSTGSKRKIEKNITNEFIPEDFVKYTQPYKEKFSSSKEEEEIRPVVLNNNLVEAAKGRVGSLINVEINKDAFPEQGEILQCYQLYGDRMFSMIVFNNKKIRKRHSKYSSGIIALQLVKGSITPC